MSPAGHSVFAYDLNSACDRLEGMSRQRRR
jgi:hypothetical protein